MKTITFKNITHKDASQIGLFFSYDDELKSLVKQFPGTKWSQTYRCFYTLNNRINYNKLFNYLRTKGVYIDYSNFKIDVSTSTVPVIQPERTITISNSEELAAFKKYLIGKRYSNSTIETYTHFVRMFLTFLKGKPLSEITQEDLRIFIEQKIPGKQYSISTHRQMISGLKHLMELYGNDLVVNSMTRPKKSKTVPVVLNTIEIIQLLKTTVNLKHRCILALLYSCGLRVGEALQLKLEDIDLERKQVLVKNGKGRKDRYVGLGSSVIPVLVNYTNSYEPSVYLFENKPGVPYCASSVRAFLKRSCKKAGISKRVTPHTLRHSYATHLVENGTGIAHVQRLLGHAKPETTMLYTHIANVDLIQIENPLDVAVEKMRAMDKNHKNMRLSRK